MSPTKSPSLILMPSWGPLFSLGDSFKAAAMGGVTGGLVLLSHGEGGISGCSTCLHTV